MKNFILILTLFVCNINVNATVPWSTYFGETSDDWAQSAAIDASGNIYITGTTYSSGLATTGAHQTTFGGAYDAFVTKLNPSGVRQWTTYYGGTGLENGNGIALDRSGNIYVVGTTTSTSGIATSGSFQSTLSGGSGGFIVKFNSSGVRQWGTYYSGAGISGISIDTSSNILIIGSTSSTSGIASSGAYQTTYGGGSNDAFIAKFNSSGTIQWATYYGGSSYDGGYAISNDMSGNVFASCITNSTSGVASSGAYQTTFGGGNDDVLIIKFNSSGTRQWATYYGGNGDDEGYGITTDTSGNVLITGGTGTSTNMTTTGAYQTTYGGNGDAFILKFSSSGSRIWATYFGGSQLEYGWGITTQVNGNIFITGQTYSSTGIATTGVYQTTFKGVSDAFVAKFNSSGARQWSTYYGDTANDIGYSIVIDGSGNAFMAGLTASPLGVATSGAFQTTYGGGNSDAFVAAFTNLGGLPVQLTSFDIIATKEKGNLKVLCNWATASEINNNYFSVERSKDGKLFENIGTVKGSGNTNTTIAYNFTDEIPLTGISYYRLKQTDFDGKYSYSKIKAIDLNVSVSLPISLAYDKEVPTIKFTSNSNSKFTIQLFSLSGTALWSTDNIATEGDNIFPVNANVSSGLYLLKTQLADKVQYFKVWLK